jgi:hypothetical protein
VTNSITLRSYDNKNKSLVIIFKTLACKFQTQYQFQISHHFKIVGVATLRYVSTDWFMAVQGLNLRVTIQRVLKLHLTQVKTEMWILVHVMLKHQCFDSACTYLLFSAFVDPSVTKSSSLLLYPKTWNKKMVNHENNLFIYKSHHLNTIFYTNSRMVSIWILLEGSSLL